MRRSVVGMGRFLLAGILLASTLGTKAEGTPRANPNEGYLGVYVTDLTPEKAKQLRTPGEYGVLVMEVAEESPAAKAGIKANDVIIEFNGVRVEGEVQFGRLVRETPPGRTVPVKIVRDGKTQELKVTLGSRRPIAIGPDFRFDLRIPEIRIPPIVVQLGGYSLLGVRVQDLTEQLGEYFGVPEGRGVLITFVRAGSPAERAGLRAGDVIVAVDDTDVRDVREFTRVLMRKEGNVSLTIVRNKERQKVTVTLERRERPWAWYYNQGDFRWDAYRQGLRDYLRELRQYLESLERYQRRLRRDEIPTGDAYRRSISTSVL
ncbi:MAG: PDZ domain-containing protein [Blastocatellia bacterium]|nr:PDZ domain-containing protein [Blastocatellia bacterium]